MNQRCWVLGMDSPLKTNVTAENPHFLIGDRSSNGWFFQQPSFVRFSGVHFSFEND